MKQDKKSLLGSPCQETPEQNAWIVSLIRVAEIGWLLLSRQGKAWEVADQLFSAGRPCLG